MPKLCKLKRLARYSKRERQWGQVFEYGILAEELTVFTDSDWLQGDSIVVERRRADAGKTHPEGIHTQVEGHCKKQRGGRVQSMMFDLGFAVKPVLAIDAKVTEHILHRQGIGKLKHINVAYLWVQDERSDLRDYECAELGAKKTSQTWERSRSAKQ